MLRNEIVRAVIAGGTLAGLFAAAFAIGSAGQGPSLRETAFAPPQQSDEELTTGSIVFVPVLGNNCRRNTIDNRTWQVQERGTMHCTQAFAGSGPRRDIGAGPTRLDIIRESFRKSQP
jgi:hypothetical protein